MPEGRASLIPSSAGEVGLRARSRLRPVVSLMTRPIVTRTRSRPDWSACQRDASQNLENSYEEASNAATQSFAAPSSPIVEAHRSQREEDSITLIREFDSHAAAPFRKPMSE